jgi:hypothetical protein
LALTAPSEGTAVAFNEARRAIRLSMAYNAVHEGIEHMRYPFVQIGDIKASGGRITSYEQTYSDAGLAQSRLWPEGTMCITIAANIAETAVLTFPACFPDSVIGFIPDEGACKVYVAEYTFRLLKERLQRESTGSVQDNINLGTIGKTYFVLAPMKVQEAFYEFFEPLNNHIIGNTRESSTLSTLATGRLRTEEPSRRRCHPERGGLGPRPTDDII